MAHLPIRLALIVLSLTLIDAAKFLDHAPYYGIELSFDKAKPGEISQLSQAFTVARRMLSWRDIERQKGVYDWSVPDQLVKDLRAGGLIPYLSLNAGYFIKGSSCLSSSGNLLYDNGLAPYTPDAIDAFVAYALAAVQRYPDAIIEAWNSPNTNYITTCRIDDPVNYTAYANLMNQLARQLPSDVFFVGPATDGNAGIHPDWISWTIYFLEHEPIVADRFNAVSVQITSCDPPEDVFTNFTALVKSLPKPKPVFNAAWGYSAFSLPHCSVSEMYQAFYLARSWLLSALANISVVTWYNAWGTPSSGDMGFGCLESVYNNKSLPHAPRLSFLAAKGTQAAIGGRKCLQRLHSTPSRSFALSFEGGRIAVWDPLGSSSVSIAANLSSSCFTARSLWGKLGTKYCVDPQTDRLNVPASPEPVFLVPAP